MEKSVSGKSYYSTLILLSVDIVSMTMTKYFPIFISCRKGLNSLFELKNPLVEYSPTTETRHCADLECESIGSCLCALCSCCTVCLAKCSCLAAKQNPDEKLADILGFGDAMYRYCQAHLQT